MKHCVAALAALFLLSCSSVPVRQTPDDELERHARELAVRSMIVDTHIDAPLRIFHGRADLSVRNTKGHFDYPRAVEGGLKAPFMSIYTSPESEHRDAKLIADSLISLIDTLAAQHPDKFSIALSPADILAQKGTARLALCLGMENGSPIEGKLENVRWFYDRGIRYITLAHGKDNHLSDSSYDTTHTWHGISPFGAQVIGEMNRLGMMVDISHLSDEAAFAAIRASKAPVITSHSACRHFVPTFERNISDSLIKAVAATGGVVMVTFGSWFITAEYNRNGIAFEAYVDEYLKKNHYKESDSIAQEHIQQYRREHPLGTVTMADLADHFDYIKNLVGIDYIGFGSDFDGVGGLPTGLEDVSKYPNLIAELLKRGYTDEDIEKICSGNFLRVWRQIDAAARKLQSTP